EQQILHRLEEDARRIPAVVRPQVGEVLAPPVLRDREHPRVAEPRLPQVATRLRERGEQRRRARLAARVAADVRDRAVVGAAHDPLAEARAVAGIALVDRGRRRRPAKTSPWSVPACGCPSTSTYASYGGSAHSRAVVQPIDIAIAGCALCSAARRPRPKLLSKPCSLPWPACSTRPGLSFQPASTFSAVAS